MMAGDGRLLHSHFPLLGTMSLCSAVGFSELEPENHQRANLMFLLVDLRFAHHMGWLGIENFRDMIVWNLKSHTVKIFALRGPYKMNQLNLAGRDHKRYQAMKQGGIPCHKPMLVFEQSQAGPKSFHHFLVRKRVVTLSVVLC